MMETKDLVTIIGTLVTLPTSIWGLYHLVRFWKSRHREEARVAQALEKERAYLFALQGYLEELDRPLGFAEEEFTPLAGSLVEKEHVSLRFLFRKSAAEDQLGLTPADIIPTAKGTYIKNIFAFLTRSKRPVILLGEPGSGNSVTMRHIALEVTRRQLDKNPTWVTIPIYLQLGAYDQADQGCPASVKEFIRYQLKNVIPGGDKIVQSLDAILTKGRALILLDSMDEMPSADFPERAKELQKFLIEYGPMNSVVVACRRREYSGSFQHSELIIQPFDSKRIKQYLQKHWELYSKHFLTPEARHTLFEKYMQISQPDHPLFDFATNPFSLKLLAKYFFRKGGVLPQGRADIFHSYIEERLQREAERAKLTEGQKGTVLAVWKALAYGIIDGNLGTYISQEQCHAGITTLRRYGTTEIDHAVNTAVACGLIRRESDGSMRFEHHRLLEYLAASYWEKRDKAAGLEPGHLKNPWWRETLTLRAGITADADALVRQLCPLIDPRYFRAHGLTSQGEQKGVRGSSILTDRLEYLVRVELALVCARQRWGELAERTRTAILALAQHIADNGGVLEQVRLTRSMMGLPIIYSGPMLATMARSSSDWLVNEVFNSIDPRDYKTPEFAQILKGFLESTQATDLLGRVRAIRGLPLSQLLWADKQQSRKLLAYVAVRFFLFWLTFILFWVVTGVITWKYQILDPANIIPADSPGGLWKAVVAISLYLLFSIWLAGWKLTVVAFAVPACLSLALPPRTMFRLFIALAIFFMLIGGEFHRAQWIRNPFVRALSLLLCINRLYRLLVLFLFAQIMIMLGYVYATRGLILAGWLGNLQTTAVPWEVHWAGSIATALVTEGLLYFYYSRKVKQLLREGSTYVDEEKVESFLNRCVGELRNPRPSVLSKKTLDRITELPLEETKVISELRKLADSYEFFLKTDDILEAIDRIDLRRRQKALQPERFAAKAQG